MSLSPSVAVVEEVRVQSARKRITQATIAAHLNISASAMSRRMLGEAEFTVDEVYRMADLFGVPASALLPAERTEQSA
jgi:transcriptional regulator with XRE-family HTH domain